MQGTGQAHQWHRQRGAAALAQAQAEGQQRLGLKGREQRLMPRLCALVGEQQPRTAVRIQAHRDQRSDAADKAIDQHRHTLLAHWRGLGEADDPVQALAQAGRLRLLTALREGPQGARGLNERIEAALAGSARPGAGPRYFHGRLLLVTENSYRHRLFNGDIGLCLRSREGAMLAWFPGDSPEQPRAFHPAALPAHESAFAMTVHKAQGSEFDEVWLQLPRRDNRVLSRELVYTGMTRARQALHVLGSADVLQAALARHASRLSGLAQRLGAGATITDVAAAPAQGELW